MVSRLTNERKHCSYKCLSMPYQLRANHHALPVITAPLRRYCEPDQQAKYLGGLLIYFVTSYQSLLVVGNLSMEELYIIYLCLTHPLPPFARNHGFCIASKMSDFVRLRWLVIPFNVASDAGSCRAFLLLASSQQLVRDSFKDGQYSEGDCVIVQGSLKRNARDCVIVQGSLKQNAIFLD